MGRKRKKPARRHKPRCESNEEAMYWSQDRHGFVRLRLQFQVRMKPIEGPSRYVGLQGKSITMAVRSPGIAMQLVEYMESCIEKFNPDLDSIEAPEPNESISRKFISPLPSVPSSQNENPSQRSY